jgi:hypothetical protein
MPSLLHTLAPAVLGSDTVPVKSVRHAPGVIQIPDRHSGMRYNHIVKVPGAEPRISITMPFRPAYDALGWGLNVLDTFEIYLAKFEDYERSTGSVHTKWALSASAAVAAMITGASVDQDGDLVAEVECIVLGAPTAMTHPLTRSDSNALPTLASQPALYTLGPMSINGTVRQGLMSHGISRGMNVIARRTDGSKFPTTAARASADPRMTGEHGDPASLLTSLGLMGVSISSNLIQYFRRYDATTGDVLDTAGSALSVTAAAGRITPTTIDAADAEIARAGFEAICTSASDTDPFVVSTSATVPALS